MIRIRGLSGIAIIVIASFASLAVAQTSADPDSASLQRRVQQLDELVENLQRRVSEMEAAGKCTKQPATSSTQAPPNATAGQRQSQENSASETAKPEKSPVVAAFGRSGFTLVSPDRTYRLRMGGLFQFDGKFFYGDNTYYATIASSLPNDFQMRKARPILEGNLGPYVEFRFVPDFGAGKAVLRDGYANLKVSPFSVIRAGKFKTPLGLQQLQGDADLPFIERSLVNDLVPGRSEGVQLSGSIRGQLNYQIAITNGAPVGQSIETATSRGKDITTRIFFTPFTSSKILEGLGFGAAATTGKQEGGLLPSMNTSGGQIAFFTYGSGSGSTTVAPTAAGHRLNFSPQAYYYYGPVGFMAEYAQSSQKVSAVVGGGLVNAEISHHAWQVEGTWVMTGEKKSYKSVTPRKGLEGRDSRGFGAWELVTRYSALRVDPTVFALKIADPATSAQAARNWAVGLNWYMNYFIKFALNYEQTRFEGGAAAKRSFLLFSNRPTEKVFMQRLQFVF